MAKLKPNTTGTSREDVIRMVALLVELLQLQTFSEFNKQTMHVPSKTEPFAMVKSPPTIPVWKSKLNQFAIFNAIPVPPLMLALIQMIHASLFPQLPRPLNAQT